MKAFVKFVSAFPFAGKMAIRPAIRSFIRASPGRAKTAWLGISVLLLKIMIWGHGRQAQVGVRVFMRSLGKARLFWQGVFVTYIMVNVAVTIVQAYLLLWVWYIYLKKKRTPLLGQHGDFTLGEVTLMFCVTLGGQLLFCVGSSPYL